MSLHDCQHSFEELTAEVFPLYFSMLEKQLNQPTKLKDVLENQFLIPSCAGCYVISLNQSAKYVGIAKNIRKRLQDHLSTEPSRANLSVRITAKRLNLTLKHIKKYESFLKEFNLTCDDLVENYSIAWVTIENPLEMYIFEPYCAMKLNTIEYNFFDTLQILSPKYSKQALNNESN